MIKFLEPLEVSKKSRAVIRAEPGKFRVEPNLMESSRAGSIN